MPRRNLIVLTAAVAAASVGLLAAVGPLSANPSTMPNAATTVPTTMMSMPPETMPTTQAAGVSVPTLPPPPAEDPVARTIYDAATPSLVVVQYTYTGETQQQDLLIPGIVVGDTGLVMVPLAAVGEQIPDDYMKKFKVIVPDENAENEEMPAEFQGRDDRAEVAFVKVKVGGKPHAWKPVKFARVNPPIGQTVYSVGLSTKGANYHTILTRSVVSSYFRGAQKQVEVAGGGLATAGSPVFLADGTAIGVVTFTPPGELLIGERDPRQSLLSGLATNRLFTPTAEFAVGLESPPSPGHPVPMAYTGLTEMLGMKKDDAAAFNLANKPAIQIGDMLPDSPAAKGGLKKRDIIVAVDGKPLERGDLPEELPAIMRRNLVSAKPGDVVTFTVVRDRNKPPVDVKVTMEARPMQPNTAPRYWNEDIGFGVRQMVVTDRYGLKLKPAEKDGVLVTTLKEGGAAAVPTGLRPNDMVTQVNGRPVTSLDTFKAAFEDFRKAHEHERIVMLVHRGNADETVSIEPPQ